jgi:hypothetical protein
MATKQTAAPEEGFLPSDYKPPSGKYMKFKEGDNRFRILSQAPLLGYEGWSKPTTEKPNGSPIRKPKGASWNVNDLKGGKPPRHFWAVAVWDYASESVRVLQITQGGIQTSLTALSKNRKWGHPSRYDIVVTRTGTTLNDTEYAVTPEPPEQMPPEAAQAWADLQDRFDLTRLMSNGDPFGEDMTSGNGQDHDELNPPPIGDDDLPF